MHGLQYPCTGSGRPALTAFAPYRCPVCEEYVYIDAKGRVVAHDLPRWHHLRVSPGTRMPSRSPARRKVT